MARKKKEPKVVKEVADEVESVEIEAKAVEPDAAPTPTPTAVTKSTTGVDTVAIFKARQKAEINSAKKTIVKIADENTVFTVGASPYVTILNQATGDTYHTAKGVVEYTDDKGVVKFIETEGADVRGVVNGSIKGLLAIGVLAAGSFKVA